MSISRRDFIRNASMAALAAGFIRNLSLVASAQTKKPSVADKHCETIQDIIGRYSERGKFDFGLTAAEETRAARLHEEALIIDIVNQHPIGGYRLFECEPFKSAAEELGKQHSGLELLELVNFKLPYDVNPELMRELWDASRITGAGLDLCMDMSNVEEPQVHLDVPARLLWLNMALKAEDFRQAKAGGTHAYFGYSQPVRGFARDIGQVERAYERGLRSLQLTYNTLNVCGAGCLERVDPGLSHFGIEVVEKQNELGMIVDTSHCGVQTTLDACKFSKEPVTANHTAVEKLYPHPRCKNDDEIKAIADTGGLIGVVTVPFFFSEDPRTADMNLFLDHVDHIANLVGWQHIGIGSDWPHTIPNSLMYKVFDPHTMWLLGGKRGSSAREDAFLANLIGFDDYLDFPNVTRGLTKRGYTDEQIKGILGENYLRIFEQVCG